MSAKFMLAVSATAVLAAWLSSAAAGEGRRCATASPSPAQVAASQRLASSSAQRLAVSFPREGITIPVAFHVVYQSGTGGIVGDVADTDFEEQVKVLNEAYIGTGFKFSLSSVDRTENATWFRSCMGGKNAAMKNALAIDPAQVLNVYTCDPDTGDLGLATFPQDYAESDARHGVVVGYGTLPNGKDKDYNLGATLVHEVGHYLGLYHTFEPGYNKDGCAAPGDGVVDTAYERTPAFGCDLTRDSCRSNIGKNIGKDPVINYMDYSDDACMREFSLGQINLAQQSVGKWRPSLLAP
jgi:hypothetical protein